MFGKMVKPLDTFVLAILSCLLFAALLAVVSGCATFARARQARPIEMTERVVHSIPRELGAQGGLRAAELSWQAPAQPVYRYRIERSSSAEGPFAWVADAPGNRTTFTDGLPPLERLADSTTYFYRICSIISKDGVMSELTEAVGATTAPPPLPPLELAAKATGSREVSLAWRAPESPEIAGYRIERAPLETPAEFTAVGRSPTPGFIDGGTPASTLRDSTRYHYRVVAINAVEAESEPSALSEVETWPPPGAPQGLKGTSLEVRCAPLTWQPNPEEDVVSYDIYQSRMEDGKFSKIGAVRGRATTSFTDGGGNPGNLEDDGIYFYRIRAVNRVTAESADSAIVRVTTRPVPPAVENLQAVAARPREVPLSWNASTDTAVTGYEVWRTPAANEDNWELIARITGRNSTNFVDRGGQKNPNVLGLLEDGTEYLYKIICHNTANVRSSGTAPAKARTKVIPVPPAGLVTSRDKARIIRIEWQPNPEADVHAYVVEGSSKEDSGFRRVAQVQKGAPGMTLTAEESGLEPGALRFYRIKALDREGIESLWSKTVEGRSKPAPQPPVRLTAHYENFQTRVQWDAPPQNDVVQYKVWSKRVLGWELLAATDQQVYILTPEEAAKPPTIAVSAVDRDQLESEKSEAIKPEPQKP